MQLKFGVGNRITIPLQIVKTLGLEQGTMLNIEVKNNQIILSKLIKDESIKQNEELKTENKTENKTEDKTISNKPVKRKIVSNLKEGQFLKNKIYSECKLVIRTKHKYIDDFCNDCKGKLVKEQTDLIYRNCPYVKNTIKEEKTIYKDLKNNLQSLDKVIDNKISSIDKQEEIETVLKDSKKEIEFVFNNKGALLCKKCGLYNGKGAYIQGKFHCMNCTKKDFKEFFIKYKKLKKEELI